MSAEMVEITSMFGDYKARDIPPLPTYFCLYIRKKDHQLACALSNSLTQPLSYQCTIIHKQQCSQCFQCTYIVIMVEGCITK